MNIIGIDPGNTGGAVLMNEHGALGPRLVGSNAMEMLMFLHECRRHSSDGVLKAAIEFQQPWPGIAAKANFQVGIGFGFWRGMLTALSIGYETVRAQEWQKIITKRPGWSRADLKRALVAAALQRWPELAQHKKGEQSGVCDAALIAEFARTRGRG